MPIFVVATSTDRNWRTPPLHERSSLPGTATTAQPTRRRAFGEALFASPHFLYSLRPAPVQYQKCGLDSFHFSRTRRRRSRLDELSQSRKRNTRLRDVGI